MSSRLLSLSRLLTTTAATSTTTTTVLRRTLSTSTAAAVTSSSSNAVLHRTRFSLLRTISAVGRPTAAALPSRTFCTHQAQSSMNDSTPNWSNRPPKETILLDGCDFEHWLIVTDPPPQEWTRDQIIDFYIKTLATVVGSEEEARLKIYSVSTKHYFAFGALISEELANKLRDRDDVRWALPDSYLDVKNKDYGGEPFINGEAVPYDPKYHEEWVRNNQKAQDRNNRNDRPRINDRSRNFERRQISRGDSQPPAPGGYQQNMPPRNAGYQQNMGGPPPNAGYQQNMPPPNNAGYPPRNNPTPYQNSAPNAAPGYQNVPPNAAPGYQHMPPNTAAGGYPPNAGFQRNAPPPPGGMSGNYGGQQNPGYSNNTTPNYQAGGGMPYQSNPQVGGGPQNYPPNTDFPSQNVPGRD